MSTTDEMAPRLRDAFAAVAARTVVTDDSVLDVAVPIRNARRPSVRPFAIAFATILLVATIAGIAVLRDQPTEREPQRQPSTTTTRVQSVNPLSAPQVDEGLFTSSETATDPSVVAMVDSVTRQSLLLRRDAVVQLAKRLAARGPAGSQVGFHVADGRLVAAFGYDTRETEPAASYNAVHITEGQQISEASEPLGGAVIEARP